MGRSLPELQQRLKAQYQKNATIERLFYPENPLPLAHCFLELALIEETKASKPKEGSESDESKAITTKGEQTLSGREYFLQEYERIPTVSRMVPMNEFMTLSQEPKKRWYVEGAAGAGKSTLTRYLAHSYATHQPFLQSYEWVFLIRLRELTRDNYLWLVHGIGLKIHIVIAVKKRARFFARRLAFALKKMTKSLFFVAFLPLLMSRRSYRLNSGLRCFYPRLRPLPRTTVSSALG